MLRPPLPFPARAMHRRTDPPGRQGHKGNKAQLPSKPCQACGRPMVWRKAWARSWDAVKFCSERCRRQRPAGHG